MVQIREKLLMNHKKERLQLIPKMYLIMIKPKEEDYKESNQTEEEFKLNN